MEARETSRNSVKILSGGLTSGQAHRVHEKEDLEKCKSCGRRGHGKSPNFDLKKANCGAFDHKCKQCSKKGHFKDFCPMKPKNPKKEVSEDPKKTTASGNKVTVNRMEMTQTKVLGISHHHKTKLRHETWCEKS